MSEPATPRIGVILASTREGRRGEGFAKWILRLLGERAGVEVDKNALDHVHTGWWYKPVSFVSYGGSGNGVRAVEQLRNVAVELRMVPTRGEVNIRLIGLELDEAGAPKDPYYAKQAKAMLDQLTWWTRAAKHARAAEAPPGF